jgi:hypothetical protein
VQNFSHWAKISINDSQKNLHSEVAYGQILANSSSCGLSSIWLHHQKKSNQMIKIK